MPQLRNPIKRMVGRDPGEHHRAATGLELIFDLTFVIAFSIAGSNAAHIFAAGHVGPAIVGFVVATFAICWAWINFAWFASAYDTDDWLYRLTTLVQMVGVLVLAAGMPAMLLSIEHGEHLDNRTVVGGYIVMRVAMVAQWLRAARADTARARTCRSYAALISAVQVYWILVAVLDMPVVLGLICMVVGGAIEMAIPAIAERNGRTPWHPHHISERYFLLTVIAIGEILVGTLTTISAGVAAHGWTLDTALLGLGGATLSFAMWWCYTLLPSAEILTTRDRNPYLWGYLHIPLFGAITATGAGLHVAAYGLEGEAAIGTTAAVASIAVPVAVFLALLMVLYNTHLKTDLPHIMRTSAIMLGLALAVVLAAFGVALQWCVIVVALVPTLIVVMDEAGAGRDREHR